MRLQPLVSTSRANNLTLKSKTATREIALIWRKNSPRRADFELLAEELRAG